MASSGLSLVFVACVVIDGCQMISPAALGMKSLSALRQRLGAVIGRLYLRLGQPKALFGNILLSQPSQSF
jgi:hypothetical protein